MSLLKRSNDFFPNLFDSWGKDFFSDLGPMSFNETLPAVNIIEDKNQYRVEVAAPGFKKEDFKVNMDDNVLTVHSQRKSESEEKNEKYARKEFSYSSFSRSFTIPDGSDPDNVNASYQDGILTINIPKKEEAKKKEQKQIAIV